MCNTFLGQTSSKQAHLSNRLHWFLRSYLKSCTLGTGVCQGGYNCHHSSQSRNKAFCQRIQNIPQHPKWLGAAFTSILGIAGRLTNLCDVWLQSENAGPKPLPSVPWKGLLASQLGLSNAVKRGQEIWQWKQVSPLLDFCHFFFYELGDTLQLCGIHANFGTRSMCICSHRYKNVPHTEAVMFVH